MKLSPALSDVTGVSGRAILEALICGERDPSCLADLTRGRARMPSGHSHASIGVDLPAVEAPLSSKNQSRQSRSSRDP
ncbi:hypothetical protein [Streptomyces sp. bgisy031]|uniref:hypothetical protein n=1 Tax=Streptomyces sp. bgisy031 TaxID=3413772 RepID=UPI003D7662BD